MSSVKLFLVLILATALKQVMGNSAGPGDSPLTREIGLDNAVNTLISASRYVLDTLYQEQKPHKGKDYSGVGGVIERFCHARAGGYPCEVASTVGNTIHPRCFNAMHHEFTGIRYRESARLWQWNGNGTAPTGLVTGIADYLRLRAGWPSMNWGNRGLGHRWDQGNEVTAYFLEYLDGNREGFVAELNAMMKDGYSDDFFVSVLGESVDDLWDKYKTGSY